MQTSKLFTLLPEELVCTPDGMAIDRDGNLILSCPNFADLSMPSCVLKIDKDRNIKKWFDVPRNEYTGEARAMGIEFGPDGDLYLVDNASPDGSGQCLAKAAKDGTLHIREDQKVEVLCRTENGGFGTGHNTVLSLLQSRVHFILNPDIQLTADTLSDLADWMAQHPGVVMARPALTFPDGRPQRLPLRRCSVRAMVYRQLPCLKFWAKYNERYLMADKDLTKPTEIEFCTGSFSAVDTAVFKAVGGFDEDYFMYVEDADLTQKMRTRGKAYLVPQYTAIHAWHRAAHRSLKPFLWQLRSLLRYFSKWGFAW
mgnify:CR=1 FL=1